MKNIRVSFYPKIFSFFRVEIFCIFGEACFRTCNVKTYVKNFFRTISCDAQYTSVLLLQSLGRYTCPCLCFQLKSCDLNFMSHHEKMPI